MKIKEMQEIIKEFCSLRDWDQFHNAKELAIGMSTESNELLELFRFIQPKDIDEIVNSKKEAISDELMDVLFFVLRFAQMYNIDISNAFKSKMKKNDSHYPVDVVKGSNKKYNEY